MRADWDRRVSHDYRFWMSDGYEDDHSMWASGARDYAIACSGIADTKHKTYLEVGCGVGRLLRSASKDYEKVYGIDISQEALKHAERFLASEKNVELLAGDGLSLKPLEDGSIDVVLSFAALTSTPVIVFAGYLREIHRVLASDGILRLQVYTGTEQKVSAEDTLHLRCYTEENLSKAFELCGFELQWNRELVLPFEVSSKEFNIEARMISLRKVSDAISASTKEIADTLIPGGEGETTIDVSGCELEYWMALQYAQELAERGDTSRARETLEYALTHHKSTTIDVRDVMDRIIDTIERKEQEGGSTAAPSAPTRRGELFERNLRALSDTFPEVAAQVSRTEPQSVEVKESEEGVVLFAEGQCLDHPTKPLSAARRWAKSALIKDDVERVCVYGLAGGYHIEALFELTSTPISVIEPRQDVFEKALWCCDLTAILPRLQGLTIGNFKRDEVGAGSELLLRPQTVTLSPELAQEVKSVYYGAKGISSLHPSITVLGPISGGTLPITGYTARSLTDLQQRVRAIDMSPFAGGYNALEGYVADEMRQNFMRGKLTEALSDLVLEMANDKPMDILICMAQAPITIETLTELRKRGVITVLWFVEDYLRFHTWKYMAPYYDFIFTIQKTDCINAIKSAGCSEVHYLPTACDPGIHLPMELSEEEKQRWGSPLSFVGAGYHNRQQTFASLSDLPFKIWGTEWPECKPFDRMVQEKGRRLAPEEYVKIFNATDVNINLHSSTERDGVDPYGDFLNPRTFELASCGAFQLVDERTYLPDVFEAGKELVTFNSRNDLVEKAMYYLEHPLERETIARAGRERALRDHTYTKRMEEMLSVIYSSKYEHIKRRQDQSPWKKMLKRAEPHAELLERCEIAFKRGEEPKLDPLVSDIVSGEGKLSETEQKLLFLYHIRKQMIRMRHEESGK